MKRIALVYQAGIANVFEVFSFDTCEKDGLRRRILQADFRACENFANGCAFAGCQVRTYGCNQAGDIGAKGVEWTTDLDSLPFSNNFRPVNTTDK